MNATDDFTAQELVSKVRRLPLFSDAWTTVTTLAAAACPTLLFFTCLALVFWGAVNRSWLKSIGGPAFRAYATPPAELNLLSFIVVASCAMGFFLTVGTFILAVMRKHKLGIVISAVTFVVSFPLLLVVFFLAY